VFCSEEAAEKLLYLVLSQLDEVWGARRLRGFAEIQMGSYHAGQTQKTLHYALIPSGMLGKPTAMAIAIPSAGSCRVAKKVASPSGKL